MITKDAEKIYPLARFPLFKAEAVARDGRVDILAKGLLSRLPFVRSAIKMADGQVPALAGEKLHLSTWFPPIPSKAFDRLARSYIKSSFGIRTPDQVTISITEECPNRCIHCALPDSGQHHRLEPLEVVDMIDQILDMGTTLIIFDGGEPTTYSELPRLVRSVDDRAIATMFTSGAGFTLSLARKLKEAGLYAVNFSLDSPLEKEHDHMRGRSGAFKDALDGVENALEAGLLVDLYVVLRSDNVSLAKDFHTLARNLGVHELTFFEIVPTGRWAGKAGVTLSPSDHNFLESFVKRAPSPRVFSVPSALREFGCFAGRNWLHITPEGDVYPCACLPLVMGNAKEEKIDNIWKRMAKLPYNGQKTCPMRQQGSTIIYSR